MSMIGHRIKVVAARGANLASWSWASPSFSQTLGRNVRPHKHIFVGLFYDFCSSHQGVQSGNNTVMCFSGKAVAERTNSNSTYSLITCLEVIPWSCHAVFHFPASELKFLQVLSTFGNHPPLLRPAMSDLRGRSEFLGVAIFQPGWKSASTRRKVQSYSPIMSHPLFRLRFCHWSATWCSKCQYCWSMLGVTLRNGRPAHVLTLIGGEGVEANMKQPSDENSGQDSVPLCPLTYILEVWDKWSKLLHCFILWGDGHQPKHKFLYAH